MIRLSCIYGMVCTGTWLIQKVVSPWTLTVGTPPPPWRPLWTSRVPAGRSPQSVSVLSCWCGWGCQWQPARRGSVPDFSLPGVERPERWSPPPVRTLRCEKLVLEFFIMKYPVLKKFKNTCIPNLLLSYLTVTCLSLPWSNEDGVVMTKTNIKTF